MKFSICTPVYNVEMYIDECIRSVLNQTYGNFELILVNDGSTDDSGLICEKYASEDMRIKVYHKKNEGQLAARTTALFHATGDYVIFLDSDDTIESITLQTVYEAICNYEVDCVIYNWKRVCQGEVVSRSSRCEDSIECIRDKIKLYQKILSDNYYNSLCTKCIKRTAFKKKDYSEYFHIRHGEDLLQCLDVLRFCESAVFLPNELYNYTINPSSVTQTKTIDNYFVDFTVREKVLEFIQEEKVFTEEEIEDYRGLCVKILVDEIQEISLLNGSLLDKSKLLSNIEKTSYYRSFILNKKFNHKYLGKRLIFFYLFRYKMYSFLSLAISILVQMKVIFR